MKRNFAPVTVLVFALSVVLIITASSSAQRRDYLSEKEADLVRDNQQIDMRIDVLTKAIDRRLMVINGESEGAKDWQKSSDAWGDMPTGTKLQLWTDIEKLLQKAIDDIDDVAAHDRMDSKFFPKAMRALAKAADRYQPVMKAALAATKDEKESGTLMGSIESCSQIIEAVGKVPAEVKDSKKKKKNDN